jgi:hypothetical protein
VTLFRRTGSFGGAGTSGLDPFGSGRGGLGRYNLGSDVASLDAYEAYVIAVGWQNGTVSDEDYLASLQHQIDLAPDGSHDKVAATDKFNDAVYTIGRNKLVETANNADAEDARIAALEALVSYDEAHLATLTPDNQQYRSLQDRIVSTRGDIRQTEYGVLVQAYNLGHATTQDLIDFARTAVADTAGSGDQITWRNTLADLVDRKAKEAITQSYQDYQLNRINGAQLKAQLQARLATLTPGSPLFDDLSRNLEDLTVAEANKANSLSAAQLNSAFQAGKISDTAYLAGLSAAMNQETPGTAAYVAAAERFRAAAFSLAEDKLRFDVTKGTKPPSALASFYRSAMTAPGVVVGSSQWRSLKLAADRLMSAGAGGGGGSSGTASDIAWVNSTRLLNLPPDFSVLTTDTSGRKLPAGEIDALFGALATSTTQRSWFAMNRQNASDAFRQGAREWTFIDRRGNAYQLPFSIGMLNQLDQQQVAMDKWAIGQATTPAQIVAASRRYMTSLRTLRDDLGTMQMDDFSRGFDVIQRAKQAALSQSDLVTYVNLTAEQNSMIRDALGLPNAGPESDPNDPRYVPTSTSDYHGVLSDSQRAKLDSAIVSIQPNTSGGDPILALMNDGPDPAHPSAFVPGKGGPSIWVRDFTNGPPSESRGNAPSFTTMGWDPNRVFFQQGVDGTVLPVSEHGNPDLFKPQNVLDPNTGNNVTVPFYQTAGNQLQQIQLYDDKGNPTLPVWQPLAAYATIGVRVQDYGQSGAAQPTFGPRPNAPTQLRMLPGLSAQVASVSVVEYVNGQPVVSHWLTLTPGKAGAIWIRQTGSGPLPELVLNAGVKAKWETDPTTGLNRLLVDDGSGAYKPLNMTDLNAIAQLSHWYGVGAEGAEDIKGTSQIGHGAPGMDFLWQAADPGGQISGTATVHDYGPPRTSRDLLDEPRPVTWTRGRDLLAEPPAQLWGDENIGARLSGSPQRAPAVSGTISATYVPSGTPSWGPNRSSDSPPTKTWWSAPRTELAPPRTSRDLLDEPILPPPTVSALLGNPATTLGGGQAYTPPALKPIPVVNLGYSGDEKIGVRAQPAASIPDVWSGPRGGT